MGAGAREKLGEVQGAMKNKAGQSQAGTEHSRVRAGAGKGTGSQSGRIK